MQKVLVHYMLFEKLSKNELTNDEIEKYYVERIRKVPTPKVKEATSSKPAEVDHDKFDDNPDFSKDKKAAAVEALTEKIIEEQNENSENQIINSKIVKQTDSFLIKSVGDVINITIY